MKRMQGWMWLLELWASEGEPRARCRIAPRPSSTPHSAWIMGRLAKYAVTGCQRRLDSDPLRRRVDGRIMTHPVAPRTRSGRLVQVVLGGTRVPRSDPDESGAAARGRCLCTHLGKLCSCR
jgi:hypothetical protein